MKNMGFSLISKEWQIVFDRLTVLWFGSPRSGFWSPAMGVLVNPALGGREYWFPMMSLNCEKKKLVCCIFHLLKVSNIATLK